MATGGGGGGKESSDSVEELMQFGMDSEGFCAIKVRPHMLGVGVGVEFEEDAEEKPPLETFAFIFSAEPRFAIMPIGCRRLSVPLPLLSCDLRRL